MLLKCSIVNSIRKRIDDSKQIPNYSNYVILPNEGLIYSLKQHKFIGSPNNTGYWNCVLSLDNGVKLYAKTHRIIWISVNGDIPEGLYINHIDEDKNNNCISNLNLLTHKENCNWGTRNERMRNSLKGRVISDITRKKLSEVQKNDKNKSKPVGQFNNGVLLKSYPSIAEVGRNGFCRHSVSKCCNGLYRQHRGYEWKYI